MNEFLELLLPSWGQATDDQILLIFVCIIGLVFLLSVFYFGWKTIRRQRLIKRLAEEVNKYNGSDNRPAQPSIKQQLKEKFDHKGELTEAWREFEDSLITQSYNENQIIYKTDEASFFFSEERLLDQHLNLRFWNSVPALLVGLGILGTFVGLVWGLIPFSDVDFANTDQIREAIKELLSGVSTAFVTSVWGMLASILFNGLEKWGIGRVSRAIAALQRSLDQVFTLTRAEEIAMRQQDELEQQTAALKSVSTDFANAVESAMEPGRKEIIQELQKLPTYLINAMEPGRQEIVQELQELPIAFVNAMKPSLDKLNEVVGELRDQKTELLLRLDNLNAAVTESRKQGTQERREIIQKLQELPTAFINAIKPSLDTLNQAVKELREQKEESSADAIEQLIKQFQDSLSTSTVTQMEELARTVGNASQSLMNLPGQMEQMIAGVQEQVNQTRSLLTETSEEQTEQMRSRLDGMLNAFQSAIDTQQTSLSETTSSVNDGMRQVAADIRNLLESTVNRADEQMGQRMADMEAVSNQSIQTLQTAIAELGQSITSTASQTISDSEAMTNRMRELLESMANQTDERLGQRMAAIETVSNQSIQAFQTMIDTQQSGLSETTDRVNQEMTQIASDIRNLLETAANQADQQLGQRMVEVEAVSNQSIQTLQTAIAKLGQSITSTLNQQQQTINTITSQTAKASAEATDQMQQLVDQAAARLGESVQGAEKSISTLLQQQGDQIKAFNAQITNSQATLTKSREMLEQMDISVTGVRQLIETTRALSGQLMTGATQLENAGQQLTQASNAFNQENERYLTANRETTTQIQNVLGQSQRLLNDFVQRFQTIDSGLQSIFAQIESGLNEYAETTRESINTYLSDFSIQLTQASTALSGSAEAFDETVQILIDMIERLPRR